MSYFKKQLLAETIFYLCLEQLHTFPFRYVCLTLICIGNSKFLLASPSQSEKNELQEMRVSESPKYIFRKSLKTKKKNVHIDVSGKQKKREFFPYDWEISLEKRNAGAHFQANCLESATISVKWNAEENFHETRSLLPPPWNFYSTPLTAPNLEKIYKIQNANTKYKIQIQHPTDCSPQPIWKPPTLLLVCFVLGSTPS